jgi:hypothetical protein
MEGSGLGLTLDILPVCAWRKSSKAMNQNSRDFNPGPLDISSCLKVTVLSMWGALFDVRMGLWLVRFTVSSKSIVSI